jgi:hypothetical protein
MLCYNTVSFPFVKIIYKMESTAFIGHEGNKCYLFREINIMNVGARRSTYLVLKSFREVGNIVG